MLARRFESGYFVVPVYPPSGGGLGISPSGTCPGSGANSVRQIRWVLLCEFECDSGYAARGPGPEREFGVSIERNVDPPFGKASATRKIIDAGGQDVLVK